MMTPKIITMEHEVLITYLLIENNKKKNRIRNYSNICEPINYVHLKRLKLYIRINIYLCCILCKLGGQGKIIIINCLIIIYILLFFS